MLSQRPVIRPIAWMGSAFDDLRGFPEEIRRDAGYQLHRLQAGLEAADWKPMSEIGKGVAEIRLRGNMGAYRILYLARFDDAVYVLHCFNKKRSVQQAMISISPGHAFRPYLMPGGIEYARPC